MGVTKKRREIYKEGNSDGNGFVARLIKPSLSKNLISFQSIAEHREPLFHRWGGKRRTHTPTDIQKHSWDSAGTRTNEGVENLSSHVYLALPGGSIETIINLVPECVCFVD